MRLIKKTLQFLIAYLVYFLVSLLSPLIKIRFGRIYATRIGHLCFNTDNYLSTLENKNNVITFFCYDEPVSNKFLFNLFNNNKKIFFTNKIRFLYYIFKGINYNSKILVSYFDEMHPKFSLVSNKKRNLPLIKNFNLLNEFVADNKLNNKFVCINNRDNEYLKKMKLHDENFHDFRNFEIDSLNKTIKYLIKSGYSVIRIGKISKKSVNFKDDQFFDLTNENYNEELQILLLEKCFFYIGGSSGISQVSRVLRKPSLLIDYIPFNILEMSAWSKNSIFLPKKMFDHNTNKYLTFGQMNKLNYDIHYKGDFFKDHNIEIIDNSEEEIFNACKEMISYKKNNFIRDSENQKIQDTFWKQFEDNYDELNDILKVKHEVDFGISEFFIKENSNLLKKND